jgi:hypothetical protein
LYLANNIHAEDSLRDALLLHLGRVLETIVNHCAQKLRFQQEVLEGGCMDAHVVTPFCVGVLLVVLCGQNN